MENYLLKTAETGNWKMSFSDLSESEMVDIFESICLTTIDERKKDFQMAKIRKMWKEGHKRKSGGVYLLMRTLLYYTYTLWGVERNKEQFASWNDRPIDYARAKTIWDTKEWDNEALREQLEGKGTVSKDDHDYIVEEKEQEIQRLTDNLRLENKKYQKLKEEFSELEQTKSLQNDKATDAKLEFYQKEVKRLTSLENRQLILTNQQ
tara:strand:- start:1721 stop:2341 length:621 start_codon:yes stop_codon:yes gene_type:complete